MNKKVTVLPEDIDNLLKLFQRFSIDNIWCQINDAKDFTTKRFKNGYVNDIICCELTDEAYKRLSSKKDYKVKCRGLVVKNLIAIPYFPINPVELIMIVTVISEKKLSPKLIFADQNIIVHEYVKSRNYHYEDDMDNATIEQLAELLAKFHSIQVPISNTGYNYWKDLNMKDIHQIELMKPFVDKVYLEKLKQNDQFKEKYHEFFYHFNYAEEHELVRKLIEKIDSPIVFCHNDLNRNNLIISSNNEKDKIIQMIDFDYSNYYLRGRDLGRYFSTFRHHDDLFGNEGFPNIEEMDIFLNKYRQEFLNTFDDKNQYHFWIKDSRNSIASLHDEVKVFTMAAYLDDTIFGLWMFIENPEIENFLIIAETRLNGYFRLKHMFEDDGTISRILNKL